MGGEKKKSPDVRSLSQGAVDACSQEGGEALWNFSRGLFFPSVRNNDIMYCSHNDNLLIHIIKISQLIGTIFWQITVGLSDSRTVRKGDICDFCFWNGVGGCENKHCTFDHNVFMLCNNAKTASIFPPSYKTKDDSIDLFDDYGFQCWDWFPKSKIVTSDHLFQLPHPQSTYIPHRVTKQREPVHLQETLCDPDHHLLRMCGSAVATLWKIWKSSTDPWLTSHARFSSLVSQRMQHQTKKIHKPSTS